MEPAPQPGAKPTTKWDIPRAAFLIAFAFLVASFPARNADAWLHLASGRALVQGDYHFGTDPFCYTTADAVWVNHAWLYDAASYGLHSALGGTGLVVVKALLLALIATWLLRPCWRGPCRWLALVLIALTVTAIGPFFLLRPTCMSLVFLSVTYVWLERHSCGCGWRNAIALLILFAIWANVDEWFLLGPAVVALWWLGSLGTRDRQAASATSTAALPLILIAFAGIAVAIVNPHHVRVFVVPALLDPSVVEDRFEEPGDRAAMHSPLDYFNDERTVRQPARLAYGALIVLGLLSFAVQGGKLSVARLLVWLTLLALSIYRAGAIPFFAVVAGPISALNLQDWLARRPATATPWISSRLVVGFLQLVSLLLFAGAAAAGWAGWVRDWPGEPPRWELTLDLSLDAAAQQLAQWRADGKIAPQARALPTSSAAAYALAWRCPAEKGFCDNRPHLFPTQIRTDFAALRQALFQSGGDPQERKQWRMLLEKHEVTHLIVDNADDEELVEGLRLLLPSSNWTLQYLHGRTTIFGRSGEPVLSVPAMNAWARAFAPTPDDLAPAEWPGREPEPRICLDAFYRPPPRHELGRDECLVWQVQFTTQKTGYDQRLRSVLGSALAASLVGLPPAEMTAPGMPAGILLRGACLKYALGADRIDRTSSLCALALHLLSGFAAHQDDGPPGSLFLAVRAARRALAKAPDDAQTHLNLGVAYLRLRQHTQERALGPAMRTLEQMRGIQALTALRHAVELDPELLQAQMLLTDLLLELSYFDLALDHVQAQANLIRLNKPTPSESAEDLRSRLDRLDVLEKQLARQVRDAQLPVRVGEGDVLAKARVAVKNGLPRQALEILQKADAASLGQGGMILQLDLLMHTGRTRDVREILKPEMEAPLGRNSYCWLHTFLAAASGDYARADRELERLDTGIDLPDLFLRRAAPHRATALVVARHLLDRAAGFRLPVADTTASLLSRTASFRELLRQDAEVAALRGMLALEAGDIATAREHFRRSLQIFDDPHGSGGLARHYLAMMEPSVPRR